MYSLCGHRCDELNLDGIRRPSTEVRATYGTAQKMRASMTYAFGRIHGLGSMHWQRSVVDEGMVGNPSVSEMVSRYMLSLHRRKAQAGETTTSARAITSVRHCLANVLGIPARLHVPVALKTSPRRAKSDQK
jgi:hypothetical protein